MMADSGCCFRGDEVAARCLEKRQDCIVLPRRRICDIHNHLGAGERPRQSLASHGIDTRGGRCRHYLMAALTKVQHDLFPDEPAAADHDDLHGKTSWLSTVPNTKFQ